MVKSIFQSIKNNPIRSFFILFLALYIPIIIIGVNQIYVGKNTIIWYFVFGSLFAVMATPSKLDSRVIWFSYVIFGYIFILIGEAVGVTWKETTAPATTEPANEGMTNLDQNEEDKKIK